MAIQVDQATIRKKIHMKQDLEVRLSHEVYELFNSYPYINWLRATAKAALESMLQSPYQAALMHAIQDESFLQIWQRRSAAHTRLGIKTLRYSADFFDVADCADVIRLTGAWVEHGGAAYDASYAGHMEPGVAGPRQRTLADKIKSEERGGVTAAGAASGAQADVEHLWDAQHRQRESLVGGGAVAGAGDDYLKNYYAAGIDKHAHQEGSAGREVKRIPRTARRGRMETTDNILNMDYLFGLRDVCSISGTTADTAFVLNQWGHQFTNGVHTLSEDFYILPVGSIAAFHHHSILEVALALAAREYIDYKIGFYQTLLPRVTGHSDEKIRGQLMTILNKYDSEMRQYDLHFLVYYANLVPEGGIVFATPYEIMQFEKSAIADVRKLAAAMAYGGRGHLNYAELIRFLRTADPGFYAVIAPSLEYAA